MMLAFTMRRMVRSAHLTLSPIRFSAQFDFTVSDRYSYEKIHTSPLGNARWTDLSTRHHTKSSPKGSGLMWWLVLWWVHLAFPTMPYAYIIVDCDEGTWGIACESTVSVYILTVVFEPLYIFICCRLWWGDLGYRVWEHVVLVSTFWQLYLKRYISVFVVDCDEGTWGIGCENTSCYCLHSDSCISAVIYLYLL